MNHRTKSNLALVFVVISVIFLTVQIVKADNGKKLGPGEDIVESSSKQKIIAKTRISEERFAYHYYGKYYNYGYHKTEGRWYYSRKENLWFPLENEEAMSFLDTWSRDQDEKIREGLYGHIEKNKLYEEWDELPEELKNKLENCAGEECAELVEQIRKEMHRRSVQKRYAKFQTVIDFARIGMAVGQALDAWGIKIPEWNLLGVEVSKWFSKWAGIEEAAGTLCYMRMDRDFDSSIIVGPSGYPALHVESKRYDMSGKFVECRNNDGTLNDSICRKTFKRNNYLCEEDGLCKDGNGETAKIEKEFIYKTTLYVNFDNIAKKDEFVEFRVYLGDQLVDLNMDGRALEKDQGDTKGDFVRKNSGVYITQSPLFFTTEKNYDEICIKFTDCNNIQLDVLAFLDDCKFCNGVPGEGVTSKGYFEAIKYIFR